MEINVTRKDILAIANYMEHKGLVEHMSNAGLSFSAMALILTAIEQECDRILDEMNEVNENE